MLVILAFLVVSGKVAVIIIVIWRGCHLAFLFHLSTFLKNIICQSILFFYKAFAQSSFGLKKKFPGLKLIHFSKSRSLAHYNYEFHINFLLMLLIIKPILT